MLKIKAINKVIRNMIMVIRIQLLKRRGPNIKIGSGVRIDSGTRILVNTNFLSIGDGVHLRSDSNGYHAGMPFPTTILMDGGGGECIIGDNCRINGAYLHAKKRIKIGRNSVIAAGTNFIDSNGHVVNSENRTKGKDKPEQIILGENIWIGLNSIILKNTIIGDNSIVAAGSVVKGNFPANVLIQGNPAKIIRQLRIEK